MKKIAAAISCLLLGTVPLHAQTPATDVDPALWVVKDADTTIYLFGTIHVLKPGLGWFDEGVKSAFDASSELVIEMIEPEPAAMQQLVMSKAIDQSGKTLSAKLDEGLRARYASALADAGLPAQALDPFEPWFATVTLSVLPLSKLGYDSASGVEKVLAAAARQAGKKIEGLETAEQQLGYFDALPEPLQLRYLEAVIDDLPEYQPKLEATIASWAKGDPDALAKEMNEGMEKTPELAAILLEQRNARWADWIKARLDAPGTVFLAVGAGHLAGEASVQEKLKALKVDSVRVNY
ncbi:TraB/GumN family protein [Sphingomonas sp. LaA6.9]|uniref:TraB/GumN family protein n=1 Tax=Sphingomonas sp. LaA6.9 TaxID=2919914 RepID=UPI001F5003FF|nr:TraB/GumN family protein [Sphingomonas sp. LaA6.9]MCJ8155922.1 TraB/GumN family protein [Sphingomonas sp. LaA6.9]